MRAIGVRALAASIVNSTIGAGIFVLPAVVAASIGTAAPFAYAACALTMALIVTCFAMSGSRVSLTGGIYAYVETAFGPYLGFLAGVMYWVSAVFGAAGVASALAVVDRRGDAGRWRRRPGERVSWWPSSPASPG